LEGALYLKPTGGSNDWFKGAFILTIGALLTKILSAGYRVPFQNIVGDLGFYIYQQVYPFYGLVLILSTYGFPVIISKHLAELKETKQTEKALRFIAISYFLLSFVGVVGFISLYFGSSRLAVFMDDPNLALLFKLISLVFLVFPTISILRGYFQGYGYMMPTAASQVGEQLIRVITILTLALLFTSKGFSLYVVGGGAAFGSITGGAAAIIILLFYFQKEVRNKSFYLGGYHHIAAEFKKVSKLLLIQGFAVCISSMVFILLQLADSLNMLSLLIKTGIPSEEAKVIKGVYDRGQPLLQLGTIAATSMSLSLVPIISSVKMRANTSELYEKIRFSIQISTIIGSAATIGLFAIIQPTNIMLYENAQGTSVLAILTFVIFLSSMSLTIISILQGLGVLYYPAIIVLIMFFIKIGLNSLLVPKIGPMGAASASIVSIGIGLVLLWQKQRKIVKESLLSTHFLMRLAIANLSMFAVLKTYLLITSPIYQLIESERIAATLQAISAVGIGGVLFIIIIMKSQLIHEKDLSMLPLGSKLLFLLPKGRRK
jgi:O-antigen/teichoic acid export membrane protein